MERINAEIFLKVVETGSFRKAAEELSYTQAGISYAINSMEEALGLVLFVREYGGVRLTRDGEEILPAMKGISSSERFLREKVEEIKQLDAGTVRIISFNSAAIHWIPDMVASFKKEHPKVEINLTISENHKAAQKMLLDREADIALFQKEPAREIEAKVIMEEPIVAAVALDHPLAKEEKFPVRKLGEYPYINMPEDEDLNMGEIFKANDQKPQIAFRTDADYVAMALISKGMGFGVFPKLMLKKAPFDIKLMEFDKELKRTIWLGQVPESTMGRAAKAFREHMIDYFEEKGSI